MQLQVIEVAIGLFAAFFAVSLMASAMVEAGAALFRKRSKDLAVVLDTMMSSGSTGAIDLRATSVWKVYEVAARRKRGWRKDTDRRTPSYLSARSFADGVIEGLVSAKTGAQTVVDVIATLPAGPLRSRLEMLTAEVGDDLLAVKSGLESWFDDTMDRLEGAYRRWSQWLLLALGLLFAVVLNVSSIRIVDALWNDAVLREAVAGSAESITGGPCPAATPQCSAEEKLEQAITTLDGLKLPVGWGDGWSKESGVLWTLVGIVPTGLAVMLGADFWFGLLTRLLNARAVPPKAGNDPASATTGVRSLAPTRTAVSLSSL